MSKPHRSARTRLRIVDGHVKRMPAKCARTGKYNFIDRIQADLALNDILRNIRRQETDLKRSYKCEFCPFWHHTSQALRHNEMAHSA